jgi:nucleotide-binding universal stress UspA family protein
MTPKRILCPVDFSDCSCVALDHACELAAESSAKLFIIHVEKAGQTCLPGSTGYVEALDEHKRLLIETTPSSAEIDYEQHYLRGNTIDEIRRFAMLRDVDLIVMGTHGRTGLAKALMGNVAEMISQHPPCQVITVPVSKQGKNVATG